MSDINKQRDRDFIDFVVLLYNKKIAFLILLPIFIGLGVYLSLNSLSNYSFSKKIQVAQESVFSESIIFQASLIPNAADEEKIGMFGRKSVSDLTNSNLNNLIFYEEVFDAYKKSNYYDSKYNDRKVFDSLLKAIEYEINHSSLTYTLKVEGVYENLIYFLEENLVGILNDRIKKDYDQHMQTLKENAIIKLKNEAEQDVILQKYELAVIKSNSKFGDSKSITNEILDSISIEESKKVSSKWNSYLFASSKPIPDTNFDYFVHVPAKIQEVKGINLIFALIFSIFISIFIFFFYVLLYDLFDQVNDRVQNK